MDPVVHFEMPYDDPKRLAEFYSSAFGWQMNQLGAEMGNYVLATTSPVDEHNLHKNKGAINGGFFSPTDTSNPYPSVVISVDNLEASMKKVEEAGGTLIDKPMEIPGIGMFIAFRDTEGNMVGMLQPTPMEGPQKK
ncbi:VOC family protein [Candidatus Berkelbacteria bacterium]|nr:VOC family protein [Candidatus Berkelbacteria bacterium]